MVGDPNDGDCWVRFQEPRNPQEHRKSVLLQPLPLLTIVRSLSYILIVKERAPHVIATSVYRNEDVKQI